MMNEGKFTSGDTNTEDTIEQFRNKVKSNIPESVETVLVYQPTKHNRQWFVEDFCHKIQKKSRAKE